MTSSIKKCSLILLYFMGFAHVNVYGTHKVYSLLECMMPFHIAHLIGCRYAIIENKPFIYSFTFLILNAIMKGAKF